jgi:hypothetical protein
MQTDHVGRILNPEGGYLDINGKPITGCCAFAGITAMQHEGAFEVFRSLLETVRPARVLEIGTAAGGLCLYIRHTLNTLGMSDVPIKTFDIYDTSTHRVLEKENNLEVIYTNIFSKDYLNLENPDLIETFIKSEGTTLVLCDGGNKINEFNLVAPMLKSGDIIMAHDYSPNLEYFKEHIMNKVWCWMEIQDSDVQQAVDSNNLEPFMATEFANVVWLCRRKV